VHILAAAPEYLPSEQLEQLMAPMLAAKVPPEHEVQAFAPLAEDVPTAHELQIAAFTLMFDLYLPASHGVQEADPVAENVPSKHDKQEVEPWLN